MEERNAKIYEIEETPFVEVQDEDLAKHVNGVGAGIFGGFIAFVIIESAKKFGRFVADKFIYKKTKADSDENDEESDN